MHTGHRASLGNMKPGQHGRITGLSHMDAALVHKLMALGVLPGETVVVLQTSPAYVVKIGYTQVALDYLLAQAVEVEPVSDF